MSGKTWRFEQLTGEKKVLTLQGWAAPHGRPRKGAVVTDEMKLRDSETYYNDNPVPTRHIFGFKEEPWTLKGRWMDCDLGSGGAEANVRAWKDFIKDACPIAIRWGDLLAFRGLVTGIKIGWESPAHVAWELTIKIDRDEDMVSTLIVSERTKQPREIKDSLERELSTWLGMLPTPSNTSPSIVDSALALKESVLEGLDSAVTALNTPVATLLEVMGQVDSFDRAVMGDLRRLRANSAQTKTAALNLLDTFESNEVDAALWTRSADTDIAMLTYRSDAELQAIEIAALLADMDRQVELQIRGAQSTTVVASAGDSWEALSTRAYGGPDGASYLREANGVRFGEKPTAGKTYVVPER